MALAGSLPGLALLVPEVADKSRVIRKEHFLSLNEIQEVLRVAEELKAAGPSGEGTALNFLGSWDTLYLQQGDFFRRSLPDLHRRLCELVSEVDATHWGMLAESDEKIGDGVNVRTAELHEYGVRARQVCGNHYDAGSLVTVDVMLSHTSDFEGGEFFTHGEVSSHSETRSLDVPHQFEQGDALVFVSHKHHSVAPVSRGTRKVLVLEFWEGSECRGAHRCMNPDCGLH
eukprot:TRINITY_DN64148_c0_g1_i1.p1 TRINITY_DN64148_c0_g1~~TRINITY_DN64148_c0_g1_i1.p1  ORF type:complete len:229 (-),score=42.52 TRINITY_DN64148_c0_g1_i1:196-882(-)